MYRWVYNFIAVFRYPDVLLMMLVRFRWHPAHHNNLWKENLKFTKFRCSEEYQPCVRICLPFICGMTTYGFPTLISRPVFQSFSITSSCDQNVWQVQKTCVQSSFNLNESNTEIYPIHLQPWISSIHQNLFLLLVISMIQIKPKPTSHHFSFLFLVR